MLEQGATLRTWALPQRPDRDGMTMADALPNHRLEYLDYEGPVSHGRGTVTRWDSGTYIQEQGAPAELVLAMAGARLIGRVVLTPIDRDQRRWRFAFMPTRPVGPA
ncbi:MAG: hypothetical protein A2W31_00780 [Planctomycetes bacterium RBG_16_64_10]|nr:MAG: hypothetical protein A2W31_00780 [Planctomycetes bacterium RBG_16_64_10]